MSASDGSQAEAWLREVRAGNKKEALRLAERLSPSKPIDSPNPIYVEMLETRSIDSKYLRSRYNTYDFEYWWQAVFFQDMVQELRHKPPVEQVPALFAMVQKQLIAANDPGQEKILWPYRIWQLREGACDRQAWVMSELARQCNLQSQIIYLRMPDNLSNSPHTICEIRDGSRNTWVADPYSGILLADTSVADLAMDAELARQTWPDRPDWQAAITAAAYYTPAFPQDYCQRNQQLGQRLHELLGPTAPRFGQDPLERLEAYSHLYIAFRPHEKKPAAQFKLWHYPILLLYFQMKLKVEPSIQRLIPPPSHNAAPQ